jgi:hypothetical protein
MATPFRRLRAHAAAGADPVVPGAPAAWAHPTIVAPAPGAPAARAHRPPWLLLLVRQRPGLTRRSCLLLPTRPRPVLTNCRGSCSLCARGLGSPDDRGSCSRRASGLWSPAVVGPAPCAPVAWAHLTVVAPTPNFWPGLISDQGSLMLCLKINDFLLQFSYYFYLNDKCYLSVAVQLLIPID